MILDLSDFKVEFNIWDLLKVILSHCFKGQEQFLIFRVTLDHFGFHHLLSNTNSGVGRKTKQKQL